MWVMRLAPVPPRDDVWMLDAMGGSTAALAPTTTADVREVAAYFHRALNDRLSADEWARSIVPPWSCDAPNHGFHLRVDGVVVGAALAFYADRAVARRTERVCNLAAWCVDDEHRSDGLRLLRALLGQQGYTFTDLSPSGNVVALNERLKFKHLNTATTLVPNLPLPTRGVRAVADPDRIAERLSGRQRRIFDDHRDAAAARHVVLDVAGRPLYIVYRKDRRKGLPVFASLLHVSEQDLLPRAWGRLSNHLLAHGALATLVEERVTGWAPAGARRLAHPRPKMFRSKELAAEDVDYLYSELTCVAW
jgi:hypothetical protein